MGLSRAKEDTNSILHSTRSHISFAVESPRFRSRWSNTSARSSCFTFLSALQLDRPVRGRAPYGPVRSPLQAMWMKLGLRDPLAAASQIKLIPAATIGFLLVHDPPAPHRTHGGQHASQHCLHWERALACCGALWGGSFRFLMPRCACLRDSGGE